MKCAIHKRQEKAGDKESCRKVGHEEASWDKARANNQARAACTDMKLPVVDVKASMRHSMAVPIAMPEGAVDKDPFQESQLFEAT